MFTHRDSPPAWDRSFVCSPALEIDKMTTLRNPAATEAMDKEAPFNMCTWLFFQQPTIIPLPLQPSSLLSDNKPLHPETDEGDSVLHQRGPLSVKEILPRGQSLGGYIFLCSEETVLESFYKNLFGLPGEYIESVKAIKPGMPLFLYNYSTRQLYGGFEALSFGKTHIDRTAWPDIYFPQQSRFPAQVRVRCTDLCWPLELSVFRSCVQFFAPNKFRLELTVPETDALLKLFRENSLTSEFPWDSNIPICNESSMSLN